MSKVYWIASYVKSSSWRKLKLFIPSANSFCDCSVCHCVFCFCPIQFLLWNVFIVLSHFLRFSIYYIFSAVFFISFRNLMKWEWNWNISFESNQIRKINKSPCILLPLSWCRNRIIIIESLHLREKKKTIHSINWRYFMVSHWKCNNCEDENGGKCRFYD